MQRKTKNHSRVKVVKPILFQEVRGRRQETICLLSGASPKESTAGYKSTVLSLLLAARSLTVARLSWFRTHACTLLTHTNYLMSKSAHVSKSPMRRKDIPKERSATRVQQFWILPKQTLLPPKLPTASQKFNGKGVYDKNSSPREGRKSYFSQSLVVCLVNYLYKLEKVLSLHASIK